MSESVEFKHLVRIHGKDLDGGKKIVVALSDIKGVGDNFAASTVSKLGLDPSEGRLPLRCSDTAGREGAPGPRLAGATSVVLQ